MANLLYAAGLWVILSSAEMKITVVNYALWGLSFLLQLATALLIARRKQIRTFPIFFSYTIFHLVQGIVSFIAFRTSYTFYFYEWWTGEIADALITLAVIQEVFTVTFKPYDALRRWASRLYITGTVALCVLSVLLAFQHSHGDDPTVAALLTVQRSESFIEMGLLLFLFCFCLLFGMTWRHYVFGIASGFVLSAGITTVAATIRSHVGPSIENLTHTIEPAAFTLGIAIWTYYFASNRSRVSLDRVPGTERLLAWNETLTEIGQR